MHSTQLAKTAQNNKLVAVLKQTKALNWTTTNTFSTVEECATSINLSTGRNGGFYIPGVVQISGVSGMHIVNKDGSLCYEFRIIAEKGALLVQELTAAGFSAFERLYAFA